RALSGAGGGAGGNAAARRGSSAMMGRIRRLEALPPPPTDPPEDRSWWETAPPAVLAYYATLRAEARAHPAWPGDPAALNAAVHAAHPLLARVQDEVAGAARAGTRATLRRVQGRLLWEALRRLTDTLLVGR